MFLMSRWAAIASYLPQRTDNDIKNYWNTHLKKKLKKFQSAALEPHMPQDSSATSNNTHPFSKTGNSFSNERRSLDFSNQAASNNNLRLHQQGSSYASSTENISRLLEGWMRSSPKTSSNSSSALLIKGNGNIFDNRSIENSVGTYRPKEEQEGGGSGGDGGGGDLISNEEFISILSFEQNLNNVTWDKASTGDSSAKGSSTQDSANNEDQSTKVNNNNNDNNDIIANAEKKQRSDQNIHNPPLSFLEKWLLDESTGQVEEINQIMELSDSMF